MHLDFVTVRVEQMYDEESMNGAGIRPHSDISTTLQTRRSQHQRLVQLLVPAAAYERPNQLVG